MIGLTKTPKRIKLDKPFEITMKMNKIKTPNSFTKTLIG